MADIQIQGLDSYVWTLSERDVKGLLRAVLAYEGLGSHEYIESMLIDLLVKMREVENA